MQFVEHSGRFDGCRRRRYRGCCRRDVLRRRAVCASKALMHQQASDTRDVTYVLMTLAPAQALAL
jgi:hypothetical protein